MLKSIFFNCLLLVGFSFQAFCQNSMDEVKSRVDGVIAKAYQTASAQFPCKLGTGKAKMLKWQGVEKCLNYANDRVDWADVSRQLNRIARDYGIHATEISGLVESSLSSHALPYDKVFVVKRSDALLPLSSSLLKFLPEGSLQNLPVFDNSGEPVGVFAGSYDFDKVGSLSGNLNRHRLFQYTDLRGKIQGPTDKLLLDSYAVPWKQAMSQPGFCLPPDKIILR